MGMLICRLCQDMCDVKKTLPAGIAHLLDNPAPVRADVISTGRLKTLCRTMGKGSAFSCKPFQIFSTATVAIFDKFQPDR